MNHTKLPYKRFFAFGCSYTNHVWPTWADIFARDTGIEYYNLANGGAGNIAIQSSIVFTDCEHKFNKDDLLMIVWSSWMREDRWLRNHCWARAGSIFNNHFYDKNFINKYWSLENDYIKNITAILSIQKAYRDNIKFQGTICELGTVEIQPDDILVSQNEKNNADNMLHTFKLNSSDELAVFGFPGSAYLGKSKDAHPDILLHLNYLENHVYPKLGISIKDETKVLCKKYFDDAVNNLHPSMSLDAQQKVFYALNKEYNFNRFQQN